jgi:hypothetical protein
MLKNIYSIAAVSVLGLFGSTLYAQDVRVPEIVELKSVNVFAPQGFDDNDKVEIVVDGILPNTCHKMGPTDVRVAGSKVHVRQYAYRYRGLCTQMATSFTTPPVSLGIMPFGDYSIIGEGDDNQVAMASLPIGIASQEAADEHLYAPVDDVKVQLVSTERNNKDELVASDYRVVVQGSFSKSCAKIRPEEFKVRIGASARVIEVLPIIERLERPCTPHLEPYSAEVMVRGVTPGRYLLHVRSLSGASWNQVREF